MDLSFPIPGTGNPVTQKNASFFSRVRNRVLLKVLSNNLYEMVCVASAFNA